MCRKKIASIYVHYYKITFYNIKVDVSIRDVNDVLTSQDGGHSGLVNSIQWHPDDSVLYSGSDDTHIAEWDLQKGKVSW